CLCRKRTSGVHNCQQKENRRKFHFPPFLMILLRIQPWSSLNPVLSDRHNIAHIGRYLSVDSFQLTQASPLAGDRSAILRRQRSSILERLEVPMRQPCVSLLFLLLFAIAAPTLEADNSPAAGQTAPPVYK